jgi:hypothetical protein
MYAQIPKIEQSDEKTDRYAQNFDGLAGLERGNFAAQDPKKTTENSKIYSPNFLIKICSFKLQLPL